MGHKHCSWRACFISFLHIPVFGLMWTGIPFFWQFPTNKYCDSFSVRISYVHHIIRHHLFYCLRFEYVYDFFRIILCIYFVFICFPPEVIFHCRVTRACTVTTNCIVAMSCEREKKVCYFLILFKTQSGSCTLWPPRLVSCFPLFRRQISPEITSSPLSLTATKARPSTGLA